MKFVIFDIDGTLTNTVNVEGKCFMKAFEQTFKISIWNQKWENFKNVTDWGITEEIILNKLGRTPDKAEYDLIISNFIWNLREERRKDQSQFREVKGAKKMFDTLRFTKNVALGIATGSWEQSAQLKLESIGLDIEDISFSNSDYFKSREDITRDVIRQLKSKTQKIPDQIIYFGDGVWDYKTCQKLGIKFIGLDTEGNGKLLKIGAKKVFRDYSNVEQILNELKTKT